MRTALPDKEHDLYQRLFVSEKDFAEAVSFANFILKKEWHSPSFMRLQSVPMHQIAFTTAFIIAYTRGAQAQHVAKPDLLGLSDTERDLEETVRRLRNKAVAHSDADMHNVDMWLTDSFSTHIERHPYPYFSAVDLGTLKTVAGRRMDASRDWRRHLVLTHFGSDAVDKLFRGPW